jgi:hypothetical protein
MSAFTTRFILSPYFWLLKLFSEKAFIEIQSISNCKDNAELSMKSIFAAYRPDAMELMIRIRQPSHDK